MDGDDSPKQLHRWEEKWHCCVESLACPWAGLEAFVVESTLGEQQSSTHTSKRPPIRPLHRYDECSCASGAPQRRASRLQRGRCVHISEHASHSSAPIPILASPEEARLGSSLHIVMNSSPSSGLLPPPRHIAWLTPSPHRSQGWWIGKQSSTLQSTNCRRPMCLSGRLATLG